ncbi:mitochondrial carrier domain-containing protein [Dipodascopsis tothii]|uniref:mitochondrial carrier domain-containing protein n=1 Tax=Dipodascopsis tothii TaxID=44089 RepID=UPI0034CF79F9
MEPLSPTVIESAKEISFGSFADFQIAGIAGKFIEYPFDTVKVRLQSQPDDKPLRFKGPLDCIRQTLRNEGFKGFYRGIASPLVGAAAENASLFLSYNVAQSLLKTFIHNRDGTARLRLDELVLCGAASGAVTSFILTPIELIKCKMQVQNLLQYDTRGTSQESGWHKVKSQREPMGAMSLAKSVYRQSGISGFWTGQLGTMFRETGGSAAWFGAYEYINSILQHRKGAGSKLADQAPSRADSMMAGAIAGIVYNLSLFPADSIKSRMQTESVLSDPSRTTQKRGFWAVGLAMYRTGGIPALYRGCGMTALRAAPSSAVVFLVYEELKRLSSAY